MECQFAFISDYAQQSGGKLHAIGIGWDSIFAPELPAGPPSMTIVARLRGSVAEAGTKQVALRLIDADGTDVVPAIEDQVPLIVRPGSLEGAMILTFSLVGVQFSKYGPYGIHLLVNGNEVAHLSFTVAKPPMTA